MSTSKRWRRFFGRRPDKKVEAMEILGRRYVEVMRRAVRLHQHAEQMHYPQFREKLLEIAVETRQQAQEIGEQLAALGGMLPDVPEQSMADENSWKNLLSALDDDYRGADHLLQELRGIESDYPAVIELFQRIAAQRKKHRDAIRSMLMRSDPFSLSLT